MLTVNYQLIENDFGVKSGGKVGSPLISKNQKKMVVVNGLNVDNIQGLDFSGFYDSVPIIRNNTAVVHYTKIDHSDGGRFGSVVRILSQNVQP